MHLVEFGEKGIYLVRNESVSHWADKAFIGLMVVGLEIGSTAYKCGGWMGGNKYWTEV